MTTVKQNIWIHMKKIFTFSVLVLIIHPMLIAQRFDWATSGGYAGINNSFGGAEDIAVDPDGNIYTTDDANGAQQCQDQIFESFSSTTTFIYKFNPNGSLLHVSRIGSSTGGAFNVYNLETDESGNLYVMGYTNGTSQIIINEDTVDAGSNRNNIVKLDSEGNFLWHHNTNFASNGQGCMLQYANEHIYFQSGALSIAKMDGNGQLQGTFFIDDYTPGTAISGPIFKNAAVFDNGDLLFAAMTYGEVVIEEDTLVYDVAPAAGSPIMFLRCNDNMEYVWVKQYGNARTPDDNFIPLTIDHNNQIYAGVQVFSQMTVGAETISNPSSIFTGVGAILKLDENGDGLWIHELESNLTCYAWCLMNSPDQTGIWIGGGYTGLASFGSIELPTTASSMSFVAKADYEGNYMQAFRVTESLSQTDVQCIEADGAGHFYVGGKLANTTVPVFSCTPIDPNKGFYLGCFTENTDSVPTPVITISGALLTATPMFDGFIQWYLNGEVIEGENGQTLVATVNGDYSVSYESITGCIDTASSIVQNVIVIGMTVTDGSGWSVYPNPAGDFLCITGAFKSSQSIYRIYDSIGKEVVEDKILNDQHRIVLSSLKSGIYFIEISDDHKVKRLSFIKQ